MPRPPSACRLQPPACRGDGCLAVGPPLLSRASPSPVLLLTYTFLTCLLGLTQRNKGGESKNEGNKSNGYLLGINDIPDILLSSAQPEHYRP